MALVAAAAAAGHCSTARAIQDKLADHSHDQEAAGSVAAGTDWGVARHMEAAVLVHHRRGDMAVSMKVSALVESIQAWSRPQAEQHRGPEHGVVVTGCSDQAVEKHSSAWMSGWRMRS